MHLHKSAKARRFTQWVLWVSAAIMGTVQVATAQNCNANFNAVVTGSSVSFTDQSSYVSGASYLMQWSFGDSTYATDMSNPSHAYETPGTYAVKLIIASAAPYCYDTLVKNVTVSSGSASKCRAKLHFNGDVAQKRAYFEARFRNDDTFQWELDGILRNDTQFTHDFTTAAPFQKVEFTMQNNRLGCRDSSTFYIFKNKVLCQANFSFKRSDEKRDSFDFESEGILSSWLAEADHTWAFDDGTITDEIHPQYRYESDGNYRVCHTVNHAKSSCFLQACETVKTCEATFESEAKPNNGYHYTFNNTSLGAEDMKYKWSMPIDGYKDSSLRNQNVIFDGPGDHNVVLGIKSGACQDLYTRTISIPVAQSGMKAKFDVKVTANRAEFTDQSISSDPDIRYQWDFGNASTSDKANPVVEYDSKGTYKVVLRISDREGGLFDTTTLFVEIPEDKKPCEARFQLAVDTLLKYTLFAFEKSRNAFEYEWHFGDGNMSTDPYPTHDYNATGYYKLCLTIRNDPGAEIPCLDTYCDSFLVDSTGSIGWKRGFRLIVKPEDLLSSGEAQQGTIEAYPVPFTDQLHINIETEDALLSVYGASGQKMWYQETASSQQIQLNTKQWPSGLYIIRIQNKQNTIHHKIIKR